MVKKQMLSKILDIIIATTIGIIALIVGLFIFCIAGAIVAFIIDFIGIAVAMKGVFLVIIIIVLLFGAYVIGKDLIK